MWILMQQETMGWQWHQLDHMQIICTSLQTDNHASTSSLNFYRPDALPGAQPTVSKQSTEREDTIAAAEFLKAGRRYCCPPKSVKALKGTQRNDASVGLASSFLIHKMIPQNAPSCWFSNLNN